MLHDDDKEKESVCVLEGKAGRESMNYVMRCGARAVGFTIKDFCFVTVLLLSSCWTGAGRRNNWQEGKGARKKKKLSME